MAVEPWSERHAALLAKSDKLFSERGGLMSLWQEIAEQFYPERASFTLLKHEGAEFADHLSTSYPLIVRRDLGDSLSSILRSDDWFHIQTNFGDERVDNAGKEFLELATKIQRRAMYDRVTLFTRATKQCDHDYATFGQGVLSVEINQSKTALLYRNWHLRDVAWCEDAEGRLDMVARKWEDCTAKDCVRLFPQTVHQSIKDMVTNDNGKRAYEKVKIRHIVVRSENYEGKYGGPRARFPYVGLFIDPVNKVVLEEMPRRTAYYVIPRWQTVSGSQYAYSPAVTCALADARVLQAMTYTLLEAAEKSTNPPMVATQEAVRSDIQIFAGGVTWVDHDYDEKLGEALRPISQDYRGLPAGMNMAADQRAILETAFYINKLNLPPVTHEMTAEEARFRVQEYLRQARPLFEPIEMDYNAPLCEMTFEELMGVNAFGPPENIPESLQGQEIQFKFESPLLAAKDGELARTFMDSKGLLLEAAQLDPAAAQMMNAQEALRDALKGRGTPSKWLKDEREMEPINQKVQAEMAATKQMAAAQMGAQTVEQAGRAGAAINEAAA